MVDKIRNKNVETSIYPALAQIIRRLLSEK